MSNLTPPPIFNQKPPHLEEGEEPLTVEEIERAETGVITPDSFSTTHHIHPTEPETPGLDAESVVVKEVSEETPTLIETVIVKETKQKETSSKKRLFTLLGLLGVVSILAVVVSFNVLPLLFQ